MVVVVVVAAKELMMITALVVVAAVILRNGFTKYTVSSHFLNIIQNAILLSIVKLFKKFSVIRFKAFDCIVKIY